MEQQTGRIRETKCQGFLLYHEDLMFLRRMLNGDELVNVLCAVAEYMSTGEKTELNDKEDAAFDLLKKKADRQAETYARICEKNRRAAQKRKAQSLTETNEQEKEIGERCEKERTEDVTYRQESSGDVRSRQESSGIVTYPQVSSGNQPNQTEPNQAELNQTVPNQTEPNQTVTPGTPTPEQEKLFTAFRGEYPKKSGIYRALPVFLRAVEEVGFDTLMAALKKQKNVPDWKKEHGRFVPAADKWLTERCWEDFPPTGDADRYALTSMY